MSKQDLSAIQTCLKPLEHTLFTNCPTRWESNQIKVEHVKEQEDAIHHVLKKNLPFKNLPFSSYLARQLNGVNNALSALKNLTDDLSVTVSASKPILDHFYTDISIKEDDVHFKKDISLKSWRTVY